MLNLQRIMLMVMNDGSIVMNIPDPGSRLHLMTHQANLIIERRSETPLRYEVMKDRFALAQDFEVADGIDLAELMRLVAVYQKKIQSMKTFFSNEEGDVVDVALVGGYAIGDRLLDGVSFECRIENHRVKVVGVAPQHVEYFEQLNKDLWLKRVQQFVDENLHKEGIFFSSQRGRSVTVERE